MEMPDFVSSSADARLGCFYFLVIINKTAANIHMTSAVVMYVISFGHKIVPMAGSYTGSTLTFLRNCPTVSKVATLFYMPAYICEGSNFFLSCYDLQLSGFFLI